MYSETNLDLSEIVNMYSNDMPSPELFDQELSRWQHKYKSVSAKDRPSDCAAALKECDQMFFPNIYILLQIACTIPVTSCECERNASTLRRLHNFMRTSMTEDRLTSLALMHIHYKHEINPDTVVDLFEKLHPRRVQFSSVLLN